MTTFLELRLVAVQLRGIPLPRTPVHKGKKRRGPGCYQSRPSPLLASVVGVHSFLALLLLASQEVVRDPPYGVRGPAYRIRDSAYRSPRGYFEEANFIPLHPGYRPPASLRRLLAQSVGPFLRGAQGLFALPEGYPEHLATLAISEGDDPFEPWIHLLSLGQDHLSGMAHAFVYLLRRPLKDTHPRVHLSLLSPRSPTERLHSR